MESAAIPLLLITFETGYCLKGLFGTLVACIVNKQVQANSTFNLNDHKFKIKFVLQLACIGFSCNTIPTYIYIEVIPYSTDTLLSIGLCNFCNNIHRLIEDIKKACKRLNYSGTANYHRSFVCQCDQEKKTHPAQLKNDPIKG